MPHPHIWHPFSPTRGTEVQPVARAEGAYLYTPDGRTILDAISSWWVNLHGHAHPIIAEAVAQQARTLEQVIFAGFTHAPAERLVEALHPLLPHGTPTERHLDHFFFSDDGSTALEVAFKLAFQYHHIQGRPKTRLLAFEGAYHGDTFGAMAAGAPSSLHTPFEHLFFQVTHLPIPTSPDGQPTLQALEALPADQLTEVAAFVYEPLVQGAGGMRMMNPAGLSAVLRWLDDRNIFRIADEVMTGFGRTGTLFASEQVQPAPDMICLSKGLTGGFLPLSLTVVTPEVFRAFDSTDRSRAFLHGHSFTANPLACAAANASLELLQHIDCQLAIARIGEQQVAAVSRFLGLPGVAAARTLGTILAVELHAPDSGYLSELGPQLYERFLARDLLIRPLGNVVYLLPPYCVTNAELERCYAAVEAVLSEVVDSARVS